MVRGGEAFGERRVVDHDEVVRGRGQVDALERDFKKTVGLRGAEEAVARGALDRHAGDREHAAPVGGVQREVGALDLDALSGATDTARGRDVADAARPHQALDGEGQARGGVVGRGGRPAVGHAGGRGVVEQHRRHGRVFCRFTGGAGEPGGHDVAAAQHLRGGGPARAPVDVAGRERGDDLREADRELRVFFKDVREGGREVGGGRDAGLDVRAPGVGPVVAGVEGDAKAVAVGAQLGAQQRVAVGVEQQRIFENQGLEGDRGVGPALRGEGEQHADVEGAGDDDVAVDAVVGEVGLGVHADGELVEHAAVGQGAPAAAELEARRSAAERRRGCFAGGRLAPVQRALPGVGRQRDQLAAGRRERLRRDRGAGDEGRGAGAGQRLVRVVAAALARDERGVRVLWQAAGAHAAQRAVGPALDERAHALVPRAADGVGEADRAAGLLDPVGGAGQVLGGRAPAGQRADDRYARRREPAARDHGREVVQHRVHVRAVEGVADREAMDPAAHVAELF